MKQKKSTLNVLREEIGYRSRSMNDHEELANLIRWGILYLAKSATRQTEVNIIFSIISHSLLQTVITYNVRWKNEQENRIRLKLHLAFISSCAKCWVIVSSQIIRSFQERRQFLRTCLEIGSWATQVALKSDRHRHHHHHNQLRLHTESRLKLQNNYVHHSVHEKYFYAV